MKKTLISVSVITFILLLCCYPKELVNAAESSLSLWYLKVLPSLFPFAIAINILGEIGFVQFIGKYLEPFTKKVFKVNGCSSFPFILGALAGFPSGAKATNDLYQKGLLSLQECQCVLAFSNNPGPIFIISTVGVAFLGSQRFGYLILAASLMASLLMGVLFGFLFQPLKSRKTIYAQNCRETPSFGEIVSSSILSAANTLVVVGGCIMLFGIIIRSLSLLKIMPQNNMMLQGLFSGLLEMTTGLSFIGKSTLSPLLKIVLCTFILNFGGASIQLQILSASCDIPYNKPLYFLSQALKAALACTIVVLLHSIL